MPYAQIGDLKLYYEQLGTGEPLIFLHSAYSRGILAFACQLLDFQQAYTCYLPDFRGHGRSTCPSLEWTTPQLAEDVLAFMDQLAIPQAHVIGYSLGGGVALHCAAQAPQRFKTLTTIGCAGAADPTGADDFEPEALLRDGKQAIIAHMQANHADAHRGDWQEFMRQSARDWRLYPRLSDSQLADIRCPAFFIAGEHDSFVHAAQLQRLCALLPNARYWLVPGGTHRPHMLHEQPRLVNAEILRFLAEHES